MTDTNKIIENIKALKGITDDIQDEVLEVIIEESEARILGYINKKRADKMQALPTELGYVLQDVSVIRFNRLNTEGTKQDGEEGRSHTWYDSYLSEHAEILDSYHDPEPDENQARPGHVTFY